MACFSFLFLCFCVKLGVMTMYNIIWTYSSLLFCDLFLYYYLIISILFVLLESLCSFEYILFCCDQLISSDSSLITVEQGAVR